MRIASISILMKIIPTTAKIIPIRTCNGTDIILLSLTTTPWVCWLSIADAVRQSGKKAVLLVVGTGPMEETVKEGAREMGLDGFVRFLGVRKDIPELLAAMDLFLLPSLFEGLPVTLIETQASGLPALVSDRVTREMDKVGLIRFLPLDDDASSWCDAILNASVNEDRFAYARKMLEAGYDISDQAYKLGAFYHRRYSYK